MAERDARMEDGRRSGILIDPVGPIMAANLAPRPRGSWQGALSGLLGGRGQNTVLGMDL